MTSVQVNGVQGQPQPSLLLLNKLNVYLPHFQLGGRSQEWFSIFQLCSLRNLFNPNHPPSTTHWPWRLTSGFGFIFKAVFNFFEVSCWPISGLTCDSRRHLQISFSHFQPFKGKHHTKNLGSASNKGSIGVKADEKKTRRYINVLKDLLEMKTFFIWFLHSPGQWGEPICNCIELKYGNQRTNLTRNSTKPTQKLSEVQNVKLTG